MNARSHGLPQFRIRRYPYGVTYRRDRPKHPWMVKFKRNKRCIHVGCFVTKDQASLAAEQYLKENR